MSAAVQPIRTTSPLQDQLSDSIWAVITTKVDLCPPFVGLQILQCTLPTTLMDQAVHDHLDQQILQPAQVSAAFRCFLIAKPNEAARVIH
jgi:hypothetical protein